MRYEVAESRYPSYGKHLNPLRHHRICILSSFISSYLFFLRNFFFGVGLSSGVQGKGALWVAVSLQEFVWKM